MPSHLFEVGSIVTLDDGGAAIFKQSRYVVEAQMPPVGGSLQYRIKAEGEGFRRVVVEHQLSLLGATQMPTPDRRSNRPHPGEAD